MNAFPANHFQDFPYSRELEQDLDKTWEAIHKYERYNTDTFLLNNRTDIMKLLAGDSYSYRDYRSRKTDMPPEIKSGAELLPMRYRELIESGEWTEFVPVTYYDKEGLIYDMFMAVTAAWKNHYFLPRVEVATVDDYNEYIVARADTVGLEKFRVLAEVWYDCREYFFALSDIELVHGSEAVKLIVPPNVSVTGELRHSELFRWSEIDQPNNIHYDLYPSTVALLEARLGPGNYSQQPRPEQMLAIELDLMQSSDNS